MAERVNIAKLWSPHGWGGPWLPWGEHVFMDAGLSRSEMAHQGAMGFARLVVAFVSVKFPELSWAARPGSSPNHLHLSLYPQSHLSEVLSCLVPQTSKYWIFLQWSLNIIIFIGHLRCVAVSHQEDSHRMQSPSMPLIESYSVGGIREIFHWGSGCVSNLTWNDPPTNCGKIVLHIVERKTVFLLCFSSKHVSL